MREPTLAERAHDSAVLRNRRWLARTICAPLASTDVAGLDRVPASGPFVLVANHRSLFDGPLLVGVIDRPVTYLVKAEAFIPGLAPLLRSAGALALIRSRRDPRPIRTCLRVLAAGGGVGIFPEAARGDGRVHACKPGAAYLALRSGAPVVPVALHGTHRIKTRLRPRRPAVRIVFGEPVVFERWHVDRPLSRGTVADATERVRVALAGLVSRTALPAQREQVGAP